MTEAFGDLGVVDLTFEGLHITSNVSEAITDVRVKRTIDGAPTLTVDLIDPHLALLRSGIFDNAVIAGLDNYTFELVQLRKNGRALTAVFEDVAVTSLRRRDTPRKIAAGAMTRAQFVGLLVREVPWITYYTAGTSEPTLKELSRGTVLDEDPTAAQIAKASRTAIAGNAEDTWAATGRLAKEVQWRRYIRGPAEFIFISDHALLQQTVGFSLSEDMPEVDFIDYDYDSGKEEATASARVWAPRWSAPPGTRGQLLNVGPASGDAWIVSEIERSLTSQVADIKFVQALPSLPEPAGSGDLDDADGLEGEILLPDGLEETTFTTSDQGFQWPVEGPIRSGFGNRHDPNGGGTKFHAGVDIGVPKGTVVHAAAVGVVTFSGTMRGYGYVVEIAHTNKRLLTRYAHLSVIEVDRGTHLQRGDPIGYSGGKPGDPGSGNSTGPHLHFEVRRIQSNDQSVADDPRKYLP